MSENPILENLMLEIPTLKILTICRLNRPVILAEKYRENNYRENRLKSYAEYLNEKPK